MINSAALMRAKKKKSSVGSVCSSVMRMKTRALSKEEILSKKIHDYFKEKSNRLARELEVALVENLNDYYLKLRKKKQSKFTKIESERMKYMKRRKRNARNKLKEATKKKFKLICEVLNESLKQLKTFYFESDLYRTAKVIKLHENFESLTEKFSQELNHQKGEENEEIKKDFPSKLERELQKSKENFVKEITRMMKSPFKNDVSFILKYLRNGTIYTNHSSLFSFFELIVENMYSNVFHSKIIENQIRMIEIITHLTYQDQLRTVLVEKKIYQNILQFMKEPAEEKKICIEPFSNLIVLLCFFSDLEEHIVENDIIEILLQLLSSSHSNIIRSNACLGISFLSQSSRLIPTLMKSKIPQIILKMCLEKEILVSQYSCLALSSMTLQDEVANLLLTSPTVNVYEVFEIFRTSNDEFTLFNLIWVLYSLAIHGIKGQILVKRGVLRNILSLILNPGFVRIKGLATIALSELGKFEWEKTKVNESVDNGVQDFAQLTIREIFESQSFDDIFNILLVLAINKNTKISENGFWVLKNVILSDFAVRDIEKVGAHLYKLCVLGVISESLLNQGIACEILQFIMRNHFLENKDIEIADFKICDCLFELCAHDNTQIKQMSFNCFAQLTESFSNEIISKSISNQIQISNEIKSSAFFNQIHNRLVSSVSILKNEYQKISQTMNLEGITTLISLSRSITKSEIIACIESAKSFFQRLGQNKTNKLYSYSIKCFLYEIKCLLSWKDNEIYGYIIPIIDLILQWNLEITGIVINEALVLWLFSYIFQNWSNLDENLKPIETLIHLISKKELKFSYTCPLIMEKNQEFLSSFTFTKRIEKKEKEILIAIPMFIRIIDPNVIIISTNSIKVRSKPFLFLMDHVSEIIDELFLLEFCKCFEVMAKYVQVQAEIFEDASKYFNRISYLIDHSTPTAINPILKGCVELSRNYQICEIQNLENLVSSIANFLLMEKSTEEQIRYIIEIIYNISKIEKMRVYMMEKYENIITIILKIGMNSSSTHFNILLNKLIFSYSYEKKRFVKIFEVNQTLLTEFIWHSLDLLQIGGSGMENSEYLYNNIGNMIQLMKKSKSEQYSHEQTKLFQKIKDWMSITNPQQNNNHIYEAVWKLLKLFTNNKKLAPILFDNFFQPSLEFIWTSKILLLKKKAVEFVIDLFLGSKITENTSNQFSKFFDVIESKEDEIKRLIIWFCGWYFVISSRNEIFELFQNGNVVEKITDLLKTSNNSQIINECLKSLKLIIESEQNKKLLNQLIAAEDIQRIQKIISSQSSTTMEISYVEFLNVFSEDNLYFQKIMFSDKELRFNEFFQHISKLLENDDSNSSQNQESLLLPLLNILANISSSHKLQPLILENNILTKISKSFLKNPRFSKLISKILFLLSKNPANHKFIVTTPEIIEIIEELRTIKNNQVILEVLLLHQQILQNPHEEIIQFAEDNKFKEYILQMSEMNLRIKFRNIVNAILGESVD